MDAELYHLKATGKVQGYYLKMIRWDIPSISQLYTKVLIFESVYCISGEGEVETIEDGKVYPIKAGTLYNLDKHDKHILRAFEEMKMACVFNPPLNGKEVHNAEGAYEIEAEVIE